MEQLIKVGIRNTDSDREKTVINIFEIINKKIQNKDSIIFTIEIKDYQSLKNLFDRLDIKTLEEGELKAMTHSKESIILFNDYFFGINEIEKQSVFLHEIGHIASPPSQWFRERNNCEIMDSHAEYLADTFLYKIDEEIFKEGRVKPDLNKILESIAKIDTQKEYDYERTATGLFKMLIRLNYYYQMFQYSRTYIQIQLLLQIIKSNYKNIDDTLNHIEQLCSGLGIKDEKELYSLFTNIDGYLVNLK